MASMGSDHIQGVVEAKLRDLGLELFDLRFFQAGSRPVLRVTIDKENGVTIGDCELASNELSLVLDLEDFAAGRPYTLEVSSPGIDRVLKEERDFRRIKGKVVVVQMSPSFSGKKTLRGTVLGCDGGVLRCDIGGVPMDLPLPMIASGKEEIQFK